MIRMREIDIKRDLNAIGKLVEVGFSEKFKKEGIRLKEEIGLYKKFYPFYWFVSRVVSQFIKRYRYLFAGYVFQENEEVFACATIKKTGANLERWEINNVVTHPDYRKKGYARDLVLKVIEFAKNKGGETCILKVRSDNIAAVNLYQSLGFIRYNQMVTLKYEGEPILDKNKQLEGGYALDDLRREDSIKLYELMREATPENIQKIAPVNKGPYQSNPFKNLGSLLMLKFVEYIGKAKAYHYKVEKDAHLVAQLLFTVRLNQLPHHLHLLIHPRHQKALADRLLLKAFRLLPTHGIQQIIISLNDCDTAIIDACKYYGFREIEKEDSMFFSLEKNIPNSS